MKTWNLVDRFTLTDNALRVAGSTVAGFRSGALMTCRSAQDKSTNRVPLGPPDVGNVVHRQPATVLPATRNALSLKAS
jgi:hypothetical protein